MDSFSPDRKWIFVHMITALLLASVLSAKPVKATEPPIQCIPGQAPTTADGVEAARRIDSLAGELALVVKVLEGKGIDFTRERRLLAMADSAFEIPHDPAMVLGSVKAKHTLAVFTDPECPYCLRIYPQLEAWINSRPDVRVAIHLFPLSFHPRAMPSSQAYWAAGRQGKFPVYFAKLHENGAKDLSDEALDAAAVAAGLNLAKFQSDRVSPASEAAVKADLALGQRVGVQGTPSLYLNGKASRDPDGDLSRLK